MPDVNHPIVSKLEEIQQEAMAKLNQIQSEHDLQTWKVAFLGRNAPLMQVFTQLPQIIKDIRPLVGQHANKIKQALEAALAKQEELLRQERLTRSLEQEKLDVTLPGRPPSKGRLHPQTQVLREIYHIFAEMGFQVYRARDVETDEFNFELLNIPAYHPARDMWDTFHTLTPGVILRTHTSPGQIHVMRELAPEPIRVILPGMVYRYEQTSTRSEMQFHQVEGLMVGKNVSFTDLKGTLTDFARQMFGEKALTRIRPSYFPFTEPSAEMDIECFVCGGKGCNVCKNSGWLEILGCGMVHPTVLINGGYDPEVYTGFAFGMGPERISMLRNRIEDIRYFWGNDIRFLEQF